jgi:cytochrome c oxidase cbb3-type subunit I/II
MPRYPWLYEQYYDQEVIADKVAAMRTLGVPYAKGAELTAMQDMQEQAAKITAQLKVENIETDPNLDIIALIAYLQRLGTDIKVQATPSTK